MPRAYCSIRYADRTGYNTEASSVFEAALDAIRWCELERSNRRRIPDDEILTVKWPILPPAKVPNVRRVRAGTVREWAARSK